MKRNTLLFAVFLFITACSIQQHHRTLSFFFDGVPYQEDEKQAFATDSAQVNSGDSLGTIAQIGIPGFFFHQPYMVKECAACHNQGRMGSLNESQPELCYQCHTNFEFVFNFGHGPAAAGYCSECHHPHKSIEEKLLLQNAEDLCLQCHESKQVSESVFHTISEESSCIACHNPHGGDNQPLLRQGACFQCHENFAENYIIVHGPIALGLCSPCHTQHQKGSEKKLIKSDHDLCFYCHDSERLFKNENHPDIGDTFCVECHNPHASGRKDLPIINH